MYVEGEQSFDWRIQMISRIEFLAPFLLLVVYNSTILLQAPKQSRLLPKGIEKSNLEVGM
jgi:hypothetical protein